LALTLNEQKKNKDAQFVVIGSYPLPELKSVVSFGNIVPNTDKGLNSGGSFSRLNESTPADNVSNRVSFGNCEANDSFEEDSKLEMFIKP
jgi:hypothetical protein